MLLYVNREGRWGEWNYCSNHSQLMYNIKASSQLDAPAAVPPRGRKPRYLLNRFCMNSRASLDAFRDNKNILPFCE